MVCNKSDHKKYGFVLVLYLFRDISSSRSEKGDTAKLSRPGFICKQKGNTCTAKLQVIHSQTQRKIFSFGFHIEAIIML